MHGFLRPYKHLALGLSLLALCSALLAPASVLAQELRDGQWIGLCSAAQNSAPSGHADADGGHCDMCGLPGLVLDLPEPKGFDGPALRAQAVAAQTLRVPVPADGPPPIRGPPRVS